MDTTKHLVIETINKSLEDRIKILEQNIKDIKDIQNTKNNLIGIIVANPSNTIPNNWMLCDGRGLNNKDYPDLFKIIVNIYGNGDRHNTNFNIPDFRGYFLRGLNSRMPVNPPSNINPIPDEYLRINPITINNPPTQQTKGNTIGSIQNDTFGSHNHNVSVTPNINLTNNLKVFQSTPINSSDLTDGLQPGIQFADTNQQGHKQKGISRKDITINSSIIVNQNNVGSSETRPKNIAVNWIICVK